MKQDLDAPLDRAAVDAAVVLPEPVAWCCLTKAGGIAYFDGRPMVMPGGLGNDCHTTALFTADQLRAAVLADRAEHQRVLRVAMEALEVVEQSNYGRDWVWPETAHAQAMINVREALATIRAHLPPQQEQA